VDRLSIRTALASATATLVAAGFGTGVYLAATGQGGIGNGAAVSHACYLALLGISMASCLSRAVFVRGERGAWLSIGIGLGLWLAGDFVLGRSTAPPTIVVDVAYLGFYVAAAVGTALLVRAYEWRGRELLDLAVVLAGMAALWSWLVLGHLDIGKLHAQVAPGLAYPLADMAVASAALVVLEVTGWRTSSRWLLLSGGFLAIAVADSIYVVQLANDTYVSGTVLDFVWPAGTVAVGVAAWMKSPPSTVSSHGSLSSYGANVAVLAALVLLIADHFDRVSLLSLGLAGLTILLSIVRARSTHRRRLAAERSLAAAATHTVQALAHAVDAKDSYTRWHSDNVRLYARLIAAHLGLPPERVDRVGVAGQLHDVGKIAVPDAVLLKEGALTDVEFDIIKQHAVAGERIVRSAGLTDIAPWIRHHHERWDGRGYPDGLSADDTPIEARIIAAADSLDAMTTSRSYQRPMSARAARDEIAANAGGQFDPSVAAVVVELLDQQLFPLGLAATGRSHELTLILESGGGRHELVVR
jgi:HD-GYP domain-containing protein (c-di-GMP phosphodiesterase class II)